MQLITSILKEHKFKVFAFLCISIATSLLGVGILAFINEYLLKQAGNFIFIIDFALLLLIFFASSVFVELSLAHFGQKFIYATQKKVVKQIIDTSVLKIDQIGKAKLLASLGNDVRTISFGLLRFPDFIQSSILIIASSFYLFSLSAKIFLLCFVWIFGVFFINHFFMRKTYYYFRKARDNDDALQNNYQNIIDGRKELTLNTFRAKLYYESEFDINAKDKRCNNTLSSAMQSLSSNFTSVGLLALVGFEFYCSLHFAWTSLENATTIAIAILFLRTPLMAMIGAFPTLLMAKVALEKIQKLDLSEYKQDFKTLPNSSSWQKIEFKNVAFSYDEKFLLKPTNLEIHKGELIFLIGKNGSGKSTFSLLLAGLAKPKSGAIYLDEKRIDDENITEYRRLITAIFSDFHLFTQTIKDDELANADDIEHWLEVLELKDKTKVEQGQIKLTKLSTGQRKRLAMLIALLEARDILILDEFAADQDPLFRRFFYQKLLPLLQKEGKTIIAISHDDKYFDVADRILLAQNGSISELRGEDIKEIAKNAVEHF
ncbi:multidrug ABC transporter permease/ATP-binding protein [Campylobacter sp. MIT 97-5078]|uniref:multidrug ABC transporter permease/ATP-binding protein n=1 Tax=Campylobacter sp. MIT 97-5078 TaxID=1548153 RepID=UPI00051475D5|nr:multidrug ABC transporter permease/ATP-binding protein [Campylobacter sp. MIT 97-5078]KGI55856.1 multidrug transporter membrane component/ATP-binding component [Campylobacter sp. MIT 97-5078]TQR27829.1 multidrug ABC transporter permease/ATP-binding protein [Campylobacter sp. MIT 97-5078]